jgi:DNA repair ATPase RecN
MKTKNRNSLVRNFSILIISAFLAVPVVFGQQLPSPDAVSHTPEYSDEELETFVEAALEIIPIHEESQSKMIEKIEEQDLTLERFNQIMLAHQMGEDPEATPEELEKVEKAVQDLEALNNAFEERIIQAIESVGITAEEYEEILAYYQHDPELQIKINKIIEEKI